MNPPYWQTYVPYLSTFEDIARGNEMYEEGFRQVSRAHRLVARVDLADFLFKLFMSDKHPNQSILWNPGNESNRDFYRRCYAKTIEVTESVLQQIRKRSYG